MRNASVAEIRAFILEQIAGSLRAGAPVSDELHLLDAGVLDSVGFVTLIAALEEHLGGEIDLGEADPDEFLTVGGLARCAHSSAHARNASARD